MHLSGKCRSFVALLLACIFCPPGFALAKMETVLLPVTLEYPFIRAVLVDQLYKEPRETAIVVDEARANCVRIELSNPEVSHEHSLIKVGNLIRIQAGVPFFGNCVGQVAWQGYIEVLGRLRIDQNSWQVRFQTVDSRLYDTNRQPSTLAGNLWNLIKTYVHPYLDQTKIDLLPPVQEVKTFLPLLFLPGERQPVYGWLDTLRLGPVHVEESAVKVHLSLDVPIEPRSPTPAMALSVSEIERLSRAWEDWDAFVVYEIESLIGQPVTDSERATLIEILLDNRHQFLWALNNHAIDTALVRQQFIATWQKLARIMRKYLVLHETRPSFGYLAFFTASDALVSLDRIGPSLGLDISRDGFIRLARLISTANTDPTLSYSYALNPGLRTFLEFGPPLDESGPASDMEELDLPKDLEERALTGNPLSRLTQFLFPPAWAAEGIPGLLDQVRPWIPSARDPERYIGKVRALMEAATDQILETNALGGGMHAFFQLLVFSTAWQESCWRQFITQDGKLRYLVSYNRSSVGLMQVNERVWRGIYRAESLRWNISYNVRAGSEILHLYLRNFALKEIKPASPSDLDTIARATYAMYNGGPGQLKPYLKRIQTDTLYKSDRLYAEKYTAAKAAMFDPLSRCVSGK